MRLRRTFGLAVWTALFAVPALVWATPVLDPGAPNGLTLYRVSSVPSFTSEFPFGYSLEGITINGGSMLVSIGDPSSSTQTIWAMPLERSGGHITSLGAASLYASVPASVSGNILGGGLVTAGGGVLYTTQGQNLFGQYISPNASTPLPINLATGGTLGGMNYIPAGQTDAGELKLSSSSADGTWYTLNLNGTPGNYSNPSVTAYSIGVKALAFDYLPADATFNYPSVVLGDAFHLDLYHLDGAGNPCPACGGGVVHLVDATDAFVGYGVVRDPVSGDILFTTSDNQIWGISDAELPEPSTIVLAIGGIVVLAGLKRRQAAKATLFDGYSGAAGAGEIADFHDHGQG
jgi:hypothetical protein